MRWARLASWVRPRIAVPIVVASGALFLITFSATNAAFSGSSGNQTNRFAAGAVVLGDDDTTSAMFTVTDLYPGRTGSKCIKISYTGSLPANVRLYLPPGSVGGTGLAAALKFTVEQGSGGSFADCTGFTPDSTGTILNNEVLATTASTHSTVAGGIGTWSPADGSSTPQTKTYRFTYGLNGDNSVQGQSATVTFSWTATQS